MEKKTAEKRTKRKLKWPFKILIIFIIIILYAFFIGPKGIFVKEFKVANSKLETGFHGLKIIQFSDFHYGSSAGQKELEKTVIKINETKPDVIIFTGDLIDEDYKLSSDEKEMITQKLSSLKAELGKYYVTGEEDFDEATSILNLAGFINLNVGEQLIYNNSKHPIIIASEKTVRNYEEDEKAKSLFKILALHNPNDADKYKDYNFDMIIAGHTHNGQINIPKIKELLIKGKHKKNHEWINNTELFVNPGIGTSKINARLFNHPMIYLYRLNKTPTKN